MKKRREAPILIIGDEKLEVEVTSVPILEGFWQASDSLEDGISAARLLTSFKSGNDESGSFDCIH